MGHRHRRALLQGCGQRRDAHRAHSGARPASSCAPSPSLASRRYGLADGDLLEPVRGGARHHLRHLVLRAAGALCRDGRTTSWLTGRSARSRLRPWATAATATARAAWYLRTRGSRRTTSSTSSSRTATAKPARRFRRRRRPGARPGCRRRRQLPATLSSRAAVGDPGAGAHDASGPVAGTSSYDPATLRCTFTPSAPLPAGTAVTASDDHCRDAPSALGRGRSRPRRRRRRRVSCGPTRTSLPSRRGTTPAAVMVGTRFTAPVAGNPSRRSGSTRARPTPGCTPSACGTRPAVKVARGALNRGVRIRLADGAARRRRCPWCPGRYIRPRNYSTTGTYAVTSNGLARCGQSVRSRRSRTVVPTSTGRRSRRARPRAPSSASTWSSSRPADPVRPVAAERSSSDLGGHGAARAAVRRCRRSGVHPVTAG